MHDQEKERGERVVCGTGELLALHIVAIAAKETYACLL